MNKYVLLLRGINVGGKNPLPMKELKDELSGAGFSDVRSYIQSGNIVFSSGNDDKTGIRSLLYRVILENFSIEPELLLLTGDEFIRAADNNPFPEAESEPKNLHLGFLSAVPAEPDLQGLEQLKKDSERFILAGTVFYLHAPEGIGRSKLASSTERLLGISMTDRNWNTVCRIKELLES